MFEHLDDPNPPAAGPDRRSAVTEQIGRRRRRRVRKTAAATAVAVLLVTLGGAWAFARRDDSSVVDTLQTDQSWPAFCAAAARIGDDQQHATVTGGQVVYPGLDADYASLTESAPDPDLRQALVDAQPFLLGPISSSWVPVQLHAARVVQEALMGQCDTSTTIFGRIVNRLDVTLPTYGSGRPADETDALMFALIGLTEDEANRAAAGTGWTLRVTMIDGVGQAVREDRRANRLDLTVEGGIITAVDTEF